MDQPRVLRIVHGDPLVGRHHEPLPFFSDVPNDGRLPIEAAREAHPPPEEVDHGEPRVAADGERGAAGGVDGEVGDAPAVAAAVHVDGPEVDEGVGVVDAHGAVVGGGDEVAGDGGGEGEGEEGEGGDGAAMVEEGSELGGGGEVVEADGAVVAAGGRGGAARRDALDGAGVGRVGEEAL